MKFILIYLFILNLLGFTTMFIDKRKAKRSAWRIPEARLILIAALGGSIGSFLGMRTFHHKTKHPKFYIGIPAILIIQIALIIFYFIKFHPNLA